MFTGEAAGGGWAVTGTGGRCWRVEAAVGSGTCCTVWQVSLDGQPTVKAALKLYKFGELYSAAASREKLLISLVHTVKGRCPYIVEVLDSFSHEGQACLVQTQLEGDVRQLVTRNLGQPLSTPITRLLLLHLLRGLSTLHSVGFVHADLKPDNLLWNPQESALTIIDFGLSFHIKDKAVGELQSCGYRAPEVQTWNDYLMADHNTQECANKQQTVAGTGDGHPQPRPFYRAPSSASVYLNHQQSTKTRDETKCTQCSADAQYEPAVCQTQKSALRQNSGERGEEREDSQHEPAVCLTQKAALRPSSGERGEKRKDSQYEPAVCRTQKAALRLSSGEQLEELEDSQYEPTVCRAEEATLRPSYGEQLEEREDSQYEPTVCRAEEAALRQSPGEQLEEREDSQHEPAVCRTQKAALRPSSGERGEEQKDAQYEPTVCRAEEAALRQSPGEQRKEREDSQYEPAVCRTQKAALRPNSGERGEKRKDSQYEPAVCRTQKAALRPSSGEQLEELTDRTGYHRVKKPDTSADMWSVGCIILDLIKGKKFFSSKERGQLNRVSQEGPHLLQTYLQTKIKDAVRGQCEHSQNEAECQEFILLGDLCESLLQVDPSRRLTVNQALQHPVFSSGQCLSHRDLLLLPSRVLRIGNALENKPYQPEEIQDIMEEIKEGCEQYGKVEEVALSANMVYVMFAVWRAAVSACEGLFRMKFDGRHLTISYFPLEHYLHQQSTATVLR